MFYVLLIVGSTLTTIVLIELLGRCFRKWNLVDKPHLYPHETGRAPLPYPMGIVLVVNMLIWTPYILSNLGADEIKKALYILGVGLVLSLILAMDDQKRNLKPQFRLLLQIGIGVFFGLTAIKIGYISNIFGGIIHLDQLDMFITEIGSKTIYWIPLLVTIIWYVMIINAFNWSDNGQWMSSGLACVVLIVLMGLSLKLYLTDQNPASKQNSIFVLTHVCALLPACIIFWRYDVSRKFISGDAGTMYLGFMIATLSIVSGGKIATVAIVMWVYLIDAFYVIAHRIKNGKNPMKGDFTHLHHRLSHSGVSPKYQRIIVYSLSLLFGLSAIFLETIGKILLFCIICVVVVYIVQISEYTRQKIHPEKK